MYSSVTLSRGLPTLELRMTVYILLAIIITYAVVCIRDTNVAKGMQTQSFAIQAL